MAKGCFSKQVLTANTDTVVYTAPATIAYAKVNINILNNTANAGTVKAALANSDTPASEEYVEDGASLSGNGGVMELLDTILSPGERVVVNGSQAFVVRVSGVEYVS